MTENQTGAPRREKTTCPPPSYDDALFHKRLDPWDIRLQSMDRTILQMKQTVDETHSMLRQVHDKFSSLETTNQLLLRSLQRSIYDKQEQQPEETTSFDQRLRKANDTLQHLIQQAQKSLDQSNLSNEHETHANNHDAQQAKRLLAIQDVQLSREQKLADAMQDLLETVSPTSSKTLSSLSHRHMQPQHIHHHHHHYYLHKHQYQRATSLGQLFSHALRSLRYSPNQQETSHDLVKIDIPARLLSRPTLHRLMFYASLLLFDLFSFMRQRNFFSLLQPRSASHSSQKERRRRKRLSRFASSSDLLPISTWFQRTTVIFYVAHIASRHSAFSYCL